MRRHILPGLRPRRAARRRGRPGQLPDLRLRRAGFQVRPSRQDLVLALFKVLMEVLRGLRDPGGGGLRPARRPAAGPAQRRRPSHRRGVLRRHRPGHAPARRHLLPDLRRARPVEPLRAVAGRLHPGSAEQPDPRAATTARSRRCAWKRRRRIWCAASSRPGCGRPWRSCRTSADLPPIFPFTDGADRAHGPHRADAARHAAAVPPPVRPRRLRRRPTER